MKKIIVVLGIALLAFYLFKASNEGPEDSAVEGKKLHELKQKAVNKEGLGANKISTKENSHPKTSTIVVYENSSTLPKEIDLRVVRSLEQHPLRERIKIKPLRGSLDNAIALLSLDDVLIQESYVRLSIDKEGVVITEDSVLDRLPANAGTFPGVSNSFGTEVIEEQLATKDLEVVNVEFNANFWMLNSQGELAPCKSYHVYYKQPNSSVSLGELWCVDPRSGAIVQTVSKSRR